MRETNYTGYRPPTDAEWEAERRTMEILDTSLAGRRILVMDVPPWESGELGYTSEGSVIHVARDHGYYHLFSKDEASVFRFGVNVHEALHQVFTDFDAFRATAEIVPGEFEQGMFARIFNLIEDPAIENFADQVVGGGSPSMPCISRSRRSMNRRRPSPGRRTTGTHWKNTWMR